MIVMTEQNDRNLRDQFTEMAVLVNAEHRTGSTQHNCQQKPSNEVIAELRSTMKICTMEIRNPERVLHIEKTTSLGKENSLYFNLIQNRNVYNNCY